MKASMQSAYSSATPLPIGVFDSGMGGLTVLKALKAALPKESFIYLGDTARLPYGTKSPHTVRQYASQMARILVERQIKALVIACNTATTAALPHLQALLPDIPVLGVVNAGARAVIAATKNQRIAVLATETTIASNAYHQVIRETLPQAFISSRACSILVALAEEGMFANVIAKEALLHYISAFDNEDTVLLGCTHFPVFKPLLASLLPPHVSIVDSAEATAQELQLILEKNGLCHQAPETDTLRIRYLVTDSIQRFQQIGTLFLGETLVSDHIELVDPNCFSS